MTVEEFRKTMAETEYIPAGSALHRAFHAFSQEALKITAELNGAYHTPEEVRALMSQLTASSRRTIRAPHILFLQNQLQHCITYA